MPTTVISLTRLDKLSQTLGTTFMASVVLDLDLALGTVDSNVDFDRSALLSPLSPLLPPLTSPPSSAAAEEPEIFTIIIIFWWLFCNKLSSHFKLCVLLWVERHIRRNRMQ